MRDVLLAQRERIYLALVEDRPSFARMNREERVTLARYAEESPAAVADELDLAFRLVDDRADRPRTRRTGRGCWSTTIPGPTEHDLAWLGRHTIHECEHHLVDIQRAALGTSSWPREPVSDAQRCNPGSSLTPSCTAAQRRCGGGGGI